MNRRSFLSSILAAAVAPQFLRGAGRLWQPTEELWVPNPEWVNAPYEMAFIFHPEVENGGSFEKTKNIWDSHRVFIHDKNPIRFKTPDFKNPIPQFIKTS